ncbi:Vesicle-mediated ER to Golgi transport protein, partial [Cladochytrium tenue]
MASFLRALRGGVSDVARAPQQTGRETVERLVDRVRSATLLEDRRAAVLGLKSLAHDYRLDVGTKGMEAIVQVLRNDRVDAETVKAGVETLTILCTREGPGGDVKAGSDGSKDPNDLGLTMTEIFLK